MGTIIHFEETMNAKNLWILTEERPKKEVLKTIFEYFAKDHQCGFFGDTLRIIPILNEKHEFAFIYEVIGFTCAKVNRVFIKTISGYSSFVDFLIFYQDAMPVQTDTPIYAIEETKTDDKESRNTGVFQRCTKFVFVKHYYPSVKLIMLYALQVKQKKEPTQTYIFGTRLLLTFGVEILGKILNPNVFKPFTSINDIIVFKQNMRKAPKGNVPIMLFKENDKISISGRLYKNKGLSHDPNIGALSILSAILRMLGWTGKIEIIRHGLLPQHVGVRNKFIQVANLLKIKLENLEIPQTNMPEFYWKYDTTGEKLGTIFIHIIVENFTEGYSIFENHAGCEKGYFMKSDGTPIPLAKYNDRKKYKEGDKKEKIAIPDLVLIDISENETITIEGKKYQFRQQGIRELEDYDSFEKRYLKYYYPDYKVVRTVVLYGSREERIIEAQIGFLLNKDGKLVLGIQAPLLFRRAIAHLLDYWN